MHVADSVIPMLLSTVFFFRPPRLMGVTRTPTHLTMILGRMRLRIGHRIPSEEFGAGT